ncbi:hypothetical protein FKM82_002976 [Ascaphus truei]
MNVSHVLRGTVADLFYGQHSLLYQALGGNPRNMPTSPLLLNKDGTKLSQNGRGTSSSSTTPRVATCLTHSWTSYQLRLSGFTENQMGRTLDTLIQQYDLEKTSTHSALLDLDKLPEFNRIHLTQWIDGAETREQLVTQLRTLVQDAYGDLVLDKEHIERILLLRKGHVCRLTDLLSPAYSYLWVRPSVPGEQLHRLSREASDIASMAVRCVLCWVAVTSHFSV